MKIELNISVYSLGDVNTLDDNERYINEVQYELEQEFPDADIDVILITNCDSGSCYVSDDEHGEISERVQDIANQIWSQADY